MQATVRSFDAASGSGSVFLDDGTVCEFGSEVFAASGLRLLRRGQRVSLRVGPSGGITALTLATLPLPGEGTAPGEGAALPGEGTAPGEGAALPGEGTAPGEGRGQPGEGAGPEA
jgi:2-phospho-L-lactate guanylyltransferase